MENQILTQLYGRGWAFPPLFSLDEGVVMAEGAEDVRQSLQILFSTEPGERLMREDYGCGLNDFMFENIRNELIAEIETRIQDSVLRYEPRADMTDIQVSQAPNRSNTLQVRVVYRLRGSEINQQIQGALALGEGNSAEIG
ncbi:GPW/gp25 family protein [Yersinia ruckeri]|uniref:Glycoprotease protein family n=1 Tax=Yersinia ruckeri TaxID=29486 RepID=A0A085U316_YERRU|nr:GPW/gp25 family protein [Yersinia ruckeri]ARY99667.1 Gene 25-like lysozyme [Yersinia ruckeri]AUQ41802.1 phage baseplate protein [Yersinia ruckeri]EEP98486.1 base plate protein gp25 of Bacteriophage [Yersinia ruckeri ATCC 29473]EKN4182659.1 GPW/gp25 family protein [Yersinia ruckeri]EKN4199759.1 GPW/gp25 family protein [Yersinia ruckeri]